MVYKKWIKDVFKSFIRLTPLIFTTALKLKTMVTANFFDAVKFTMASYARYIYWCVSVYLFTHWKFLIFEYIV